MSFTKAQLYPCNPNTMRGTATKLSSSKDRIVYANGKSIIVRDLKDPGVSFAYSGHVQNTTVARISPSGYYCASADISGAVRVWDTVGEDQILKGEYKVISGKINDLEWDGESKRLIAVGDGRDKFGHAFMFDSGSSAGEISGHSKVVNAVAIRHQRPFRAATASDDATIVFHHGTPYKYNTTIKTHTKFIQDVRYAPSGNHFSSVGSDSKIFLYDGTTGETLKEFTNDLHTGSIMACSWSPDSKSLLTSAADCTVKLWDVETSQAITTWSLKQTVDNQQVGNAWTQGDDLVSLSISSDLNVFDKRIGDKPSRVIQAPQKAITAAAPVSSDTFVVGTANGRVLSFSAGEATHVDGDGHSNLVSSIAAIPSASGKLVSSGFDDRIREIEGHSFNSALAPTGSQPKSLAVVADGTVFVAETHGLEAFRDNQKVFELSTKYSPSSVAANGDVVAVGGEDMKVRLYDWNGQGLKEVGVLDGNKGAVSALSISPDGALLVAGDSVGKLYLFDVKKRDLVTSRWAFHSGRINAVSWTSDGKHCVSGSLDTHVYVWSVQKPMKNIAIKNAGPGGVNSVFWLEHNEKKGKFISAGADSCIRVWEVTFHA